MTTRCARKSAGHTDTDTRLGWVKLSQQVCPPDLGQRTTALVTSGPAMRDKGACLLRFHSAAMLHKSAHHASFLLILSIIVMMLDRLPRLPPVGAMLNRPQLFGR